MTSYAGKTDRRHPRHWNACLRPPDLVHGCLVKLALLGTLNDVSSWLFLTRLCWDFSISLDHLLLFFVLLVHPPSHSLLSLFPSSFLVSVIPGASLLLVTILACAINPESIPFKMLVSVTTLSSVLALAGFTSAAFYKRETTSISLYAYGGTLGGLNVFYADSLAYVGFVSPVGASITSNITCKSKFKHQILNPILVLTFLSQRGRLRRYCCLDHHRQFY